MTVISKLFAQSEKFQQFVKAEMLPCQPIFGYYGNFVLRRLMKPVNTHAVEQMDDSRQKKTEPSSSENAKKKILPGHKTYTGVST